ncbi:hypothetical protein G6F70_006148 [Rhizopus microsporus]|uniref:Zn(2)-C6 fungal-type domain-containing protein n=2 Tax=Rhizopus TaxID=4842 RepID=A0A0A1P8R6_RHIZD|nr:hypothetical protein G6F71_006004 [Rhizopus microsporus]KAG1198044.1 hypothetical protein G6F70_006148 [Rhizopus microsporus]KAG1209787.1 hypothetical protein G6F69_006060 [Rhizopus microsporus]KAG1231444.1 hypothetical protein G6F67_005756 [Rhizopus microsporus]KAG1263753.1 hypothetical protein G6F68_004906 [Rhizopus microsporus]
MSRKKFTEYQFIDVNDPERYKKIKVIRACDFCRKRKSKCDLAVPGAGMCSNCKKANINCVFSSSDIRSKKQLFTQDPLQQFYHHYLKQRPNLAVDKKGQCTFEKSVSSVYSHVTMTTSENYMSTQMESELFDAYFAFVHPFYPVLDRYETMQAIKRQPSNLPPALKSIILALALHFYLPSSAHAVAGSYYQHAITQFDHAVCLSNIQILLLMYKYQEVITPVGTPLSMSAISHLKTAKLMMDQLVEDITVLWTFENELICRASWVWYINVAFSNLADARFKDMLQFAIPPTRLPSLTETEQYDKTSLNIICNFLHLISLAIIYAQTICFISSHSSLFYNTDCQEITTFANQLEAWHKALPNHLFISLSVNPVPLYTTHDPNNAMAHDQSKTESFAAYLGLIRDSLELLIAVHTRPFTASKVVLNLVSRAYSLTLGDVQPANYTRLAAIQGSRLIAYGLTLALQALQYDTQEKARIEPIESMAIDIFNTISVSSKLTVGIQSLKEEEIARKSLGDDDYVISGNTLYCDTGFPLPTQLPPLHSKPFYPTSTPSFERSLSSSSSSGISQVQEHHHSWTSYQWENGNYNIDQQDHFQHNSKAMLSQGTGAPLTPREEFITPTVIDDYLQSGQKDTSILVAPMPFNTINPSFELFPLKSCRRQQK